MGYTVRPVAYDMVAIIKASDVRRRRVLDMRRRKMTYEAIAAALGVSRQRAHAIHHEAVAAAKRKGNGA